MNARITAPGIYEMPEADYHADPCPMPSLSSGIAKILIRRSPLHAMDAHPRMGGHSAGPTKAMDHGTILHRLILGAGGDFDALPFADYKTGAAKEARDASRAAGRTPVLVDELRELQDAAAAALEQMREHQDLKAFFAPGQSEAVIAWQEPGAWIRCMVDRLPHDPRSPWFDIKTVAQSAAPADLERAFIKDHAFQRAFYLRGARYVGRAPRDKLYIGVERKRPYAVSVMTAAQSMADVAEAEVERAIDLWKRCMREDRWPGYSQQTAFVSAPNWMLQAEMTNEEEEIAA